MKIIHRGHALTQQQVATIMPVLRDHVHGMFSSFAEFEEAVDEALDDAGLPVPPDGEVRH